MKRISEGVSFLEYFWFNGAKKQISSFFPCRGNTLSKSWQACRRGPGHSKCLKLEVCAASAEVQKSASASSGQSMDWIALAHGDVTANKLQEGEDVTRDILCRPKELVAPLPPSNLSVLKACLCSFHSWALRYDGIVGLLIGHTVGKRLCSSSTLAGFSFQEMMSDCKLKQLLEDKNFKVVGLAFRGSPDHEGDKQKAHEWMSAILSVGQLSAACVYAARLLILMFTQMHAHICNCIQFSNSRFIQMHTNTYIQIHATWLRR